MKILLIMSMLLLSGNLSAQWQTEIGLSTGFKKDVLRNYYTIHCVGGRSWSRNLLRIESVASVGISTPVGEYASVDGMLEAGIGAGNNASYFTVGPSYSISKQGGLGVYLAIGIGMNKSSIRFAIKQDEYKAISFRVTLFSHSPFK